MLVARIMLVVIACLLSGCIDGQEEIWLEADGSGRVEVSYSVPKAAARLQGGEAGVSEMVGKFLADTPTIRSSSHRVTTEDDRLRVQVSATFDSVLDLKEFATGPATKALPSSARALAGTVKIRTQGRTVDFERRIVPGSVLPGIGFLPTSNFQGRSLRYTVHLPTAPIESNATRTLNGGRSLIWEFPLADAIRGPITTRFVAKVPIPPWLIGACALLLLSAVGLAVFAIRRLGKSSRAGDFPAVG
jgi:hypothetical protein